MDLSLLVSTITLIVTVSYYYRMVVLMEASQEASLFDTLHSEYARTEVMEAFKLIDDFGLTHDHESVACAYGKEKLDRTDMGAALDKSRRLILHWYQKVVYFHRFGLLHKRYFEEFPGKARAQHFVNAVEPLALASCKIYKNPNCTQTFDYIREMYGLPDRRPMKCAEVYHEESSKRSDTKEKEEL